MQLSDLDKNLVYYLASPYSTPKWKTVAQHRLGQIEEREVNPMQGMRGGTYSMEVQNQYKILSTKFNNYPEVAYVGEDNLKRVRYNMIMHVGATLFNQGFTLIEPIASSHPMAEKFQLGGTFETWEKRDKNLLRVSDGGILVACFDGWKHSTGVNEEILYMMELEKPIYLMTIDFKDPKVITNVELFD